MDQQDDGSSQPPRIVLLADGSGRFPPLHHVQLRAFLLHGRSFRFLLSFLLFFFLGTLRCVLWRRDTGLQFLLQLPTGLLAQHAVLIHVIDGVLTAGAVRVGAGFVEKPFFQAPGVQFQQILVVLEVLVGDLVQIVPAVTVFRSWTLSGTGV